MPKAEVGSEFYTKPDPVVKVSGRTTFSACVVVTKRERNSESGMHEQTDLVELRKIN